jgi:hypothetical protein
MTDLGEQRLRVHEAGRRGLFDREIGGRRVLGRVDDHRRDRSDLEVQALGSSRASPRANAVDTRERGLLDLVTGRAGDDERHLSFPSMFQRASRSGAERRSSENTVVSSAVARSAESSASRTAPRIARTAGASASRSGTWSPWRAAVGGGRPMRTGSSVRASPEIGRRFFGSKMWIVRRISSGFSGSARGVSRSAAS